MLVRFVITTSMKDSDSGAFESAAARVKSRVRRPLVEELQRNIELPHSPAARQGLHQHQPLPSPSHSSSRQHHGESPSQAFPELSAEHAVCCDPQVPPILASVHEAMHVRPPERHSPEAACFGGAPALHLHQPSPSSPSQLFVVQHQ